jgi:DNA polymerase III subunit beta
MKIQTTRENLLGPLSLAGNVVERRQTLPILSCVLLKVDPSGINITATDLEVELTTLAVGHCDQTGAFAIPARKLLDICRTLPEQADISLIIEQNKVRIQSGYSRFALSILPAQDYPTIDPAPSQHIIDMPADVFLNLIQKTQFSMALQDVRYYLNGLLLEFRNNRARAIATDGHRMAMAERSVTQAEDADIQVILPRKAVTELARLLGNETATIHMELSSSYARIAFAEHVVFTTKLIDGKFPDYERVIPKPAAHLVTVSRESLKQALIRTSILSTEKFKGIRLDLMPGKMRLQANNPEQEEAEEELEINYAGDDLSIGFNVAYLVEVMNAIDEDTIELSIRDSNSSALICGVGNQQNRYVVMPMRL